ncbi:MAG: hypothetical protein LAN63_15990 [Acidobacteriia bacterium]|nr:hypothetical protein [Terriglobia bacterium]
MKTLCLTLGLVSLAFCLGCGSGSSNPGPTGPFSNASLNGQYAYQLSGTDLINGVGFREIGSFTADGAGHITGGSDDFVDDGVGVVSTTILNTSTYSISGDGTATAVLNFSDTSVITLAMTVASTSRVYLIEADTFATGAGIAEKQSAAAFSSPPSGTFAFRMHTTNGAFTSTGSTGSVGVFTIASGIASGSEDVSDAGVASQRTITSGLFNGPDGNGRATGTLTDSSPATSSFVYYVVDGNNIRFLSTDIGILGLGRAEKQSGPFSNASLSGNYAFGGNGDTLTSVGNLRAVGQFMADGSGNIPSGAVDAVEDGTTATNVSFTGTYAVNSVTGRVGAALSGGVITNEVLYLVSPSRAFFLVTDAGNVADGTVDLQSSSSFSNSTMNGTFAFLMDGFNSSFFIDRVATLKWDGAGNLTLNELVNASGTINVPGPLTGTYSVASNGRTTGTITTLSNNMVFYLVSGSKAYILQNDTSTEIDGITELQVAP